MGTPRRPQWADRGDDAPSQPSRRRRDRAAPDPPPATRGRHHLRAIAITTVARTLLDLAAVLDAHRLERALHGAEVLELLDLREIEATIARNPGQRAVGRLRAALAQPSPGATRSQLEKRFLELCHHFDLLLPILNARIATAEGTFEVDTLWPAQKLIVELDGGAVHRTRRAFEEDRRRDAALAAEGYLVVRLTWTRIVEDAEGVVDELRRILAIRASRPAGHV
jgi:very-short-patch-repair endonuclease